MKEAIKLEKGFDSDIEYLVKVCNEDTIFLSDWNKCNDDFDFPEDIVKKAVSNYAHRNLYTFSEEIDDIKEEYASKFSTEDYTLPSNRYTIVSNATIGGFLSMNSIRKQINGKIHALLIAPVYFVYINVLRDFGAYIEYMEANLEGDSIVSVEDVERVVKEKGINLIVITDPLFSTGVSLGEECFEQLAELTDKYNTYLYIDNVYGATQWDEKPKLVDYHKIGLTVRYEKIVLVDSVAKRLFLNGLKIAFIYGNPDIILCAESAATDYCGSISYPQMEMFFQLYNGKNERVIYELIERVTSSCKSRFELIQNTLEDTGLVTSKCKEGIFCLVGIPYYMIPYKKEKIMDEIMERHNILIINHDRYLYQSKEYFFFRVNLTMKPELIVSGLQRIIEGLENDKVAMSLK